MRSLRIAFLSRTVTFTPRAFASLRTRSAKSRGRMSFEGVLPRSRTRPRDARHDPGVLDFAAFGLREGAGRLEGDGGERLLLGLARLVVREPVVGEEERAEEELPGLGRRPFS